MDRLTLIKSMLKKDAPIMYDVLGTSKVNGIPTINLKIGIIDEFNEMLVVVKEGISLEHSRIRKFHNSEGKFEDYPFFEPWSDFVSSNIESLEPASVPL